MSVSSVLQHAELGGLAEAWLTEGAAAVELRAEEEVVHRWRLPGPPSSAPVPAWLVVPIQVGDRYAGEWCVAGLGGPAIRARLVAEASLLASLVGLEVELDSMTAALVETQDQFLALTDLARSLRSHLSIDDTLRALAREAIRLIGGEASFAAFFAPDGLHVRHTGVPLDEAALHDLLEQLRASGRDIVARHAPSAVPLGGRSLAVVPIWVRGAVGGGVGLVNKHSIGFTSPDLTLLQAIAQQAGIHLENVLLHQETVEQVQLQAQLRLAKEIQTRLLPTVVPVVAGLEISARARTAHLVGGDYYDFIEGTDHPFAFTVGDVAGKGIAAALLMSMARTVTRNAACFMPTPTPASIIERVNGDLYDDFTRVGLFATAFVGQFDPVQRTLSYANAGHSPVLYCPAGGPPALLHADGTALGILPESMSANQMLPLGPGDVLVVATDGLSEASNPAGEPFGYDRLLQLAGSLAKSTASASDIVHGLFDAIELFTADMPQHDDQTLVVIKGIESRDRTDHG